MNKVELLLKTFVAYYEREISTDYGIQVIASPFQILDFQHDLGLIYMGLPAHLKDDFMFKGKNQKIIYKEKLLELTDWLDHYSAMYYHSNNRIDDDCRYEQQSILDVISLVRHEFGKKLELSPRAAGAICYVLCKMNLREYPSNMYRKAGEYFQSFAKEIGIKFDSHISTGFNKWKQGELVSIDVVKSYFKSDPGALSIINEIEHQNKL